MEAVGSADEGWWMIESVVRSESQGLKRKEVRSNTVRDFPVLDG